MRALSEILYVVLPFACVAAVPASRGPGAPGRRIVLGIALYQAILLGIGLGLGTVGRLTPGWAAAAHTIAIAALAWRALRHERQGWHGWRPAHVLAALRTRRGLALAGLACGIAVSVAAQLGADALHGTRHFDGLIYHVPRVLAWAGQGGFAPWPTPTWHQIGLPVAGDVILGTRVFLGLGWAGAALVCAWLTAGAIGAVATLGLELGLPRSRAWLAALLFASFPAVGLRVWAWNTDVCAAFPLLAAAMIVLRIPRARVDGTAGPAAIAAAVGLAGMSVACKPTLAVVAVLGAVAVAVRLRMRWREPALLGAAAMAALASGAVLLGSYWPTYRAFGDFAGGQAGRAHGVDGAGEAVRSAAATLVHWVLEPLGYAPPGLRGWLPGLVQRVYGPMGLLDPRFAVAPEAWEPLASPDSGRTAFATVLAVPALIAALPRRARAPAAVAGAVVFLAIAAPINPQPWSGRFALPLFAGFALLWVAPTAVARGRGRWIPIGVTAACVAGLVATTAYYAVLDARRERPGEPFHYASVGERVRIAAVLQGEPLCVLGGNGNEVLLAGPERPFSLRYLVCAEGTSGVLRREERRGCNAVAVVHRGRDRFAAGSALPAPLPSPAAACPPVDVPSLRASLAAEGWAQLVQNSNVDVWVRNAAIPR